MTYTKPQIVVQGDAIRVIEILDKPNGQMLDAATGHRDFDPAYDLDE